VQSVIQRLQLDYFMFADRKFKFASACHLSRRVFSELKFVSSHIGTATGATALIGDLRQQCCAQDQQLCSVNGLV
jgi:hypothetical protein